MNLEIKQLEHRISNCLVNACSLVANWKTGKYEHLLISESYLSIKDINKGYINNENISVINENQLLDIFRNEYHLDYKWKRSFCENDLELIKNKLDEGYPVGITTNLYYCNWSSLYNKDKSDYHFILLTGYENDYFYCLDNISLKMEIISFQEVLRSCTEYVTFSPFLDAITNYLDDNYNAMILFNRNTFLNSINSYINQIEKFLVSNEDGNSFTLESVPLARRCKSMDDNHKDMIFYLHQKECYDLDSLLEEICKEWNMTKNGLIKVGFSSNKKGNMQNILNHFIKIKELEEELFSNLLNIK